MEQNEQFETTQWSVVQRAGDQDSVIARSALQALCQRYWFPLYTFVRCKGFSASDAEDLTQSFFTDLLRRKDVQKADPERGRFRSFLLGSMKNFISNEWDKRKALKRGGGQPIFSMDFADADSRYRMEVEDKSSAAMPATDTLFERQWAMTLLDRVHRLLASEYETRGKKHTFQVLKDFLAGKNQESTLAEAASKLGQSEVAAKVTVHRMRSRFGHLLRQEIMTTVESETEVDDEIGRLFEALKR